MDKKKLDKPPEWQMISSDNVIVLKPKEHCTLLFKYLSFRNIDPFSIEDNEEKNKEKIDSSSALKKRTIHVYFNILKGRVYGGFSVKVNPYNQIVDHVFRYFEKETKRVNLILPALYYFSQTPITKYKLK